MARAFRGFTLVEVMITMVIVAIGLALAFPTWENAVQKRNVTSAAEEIAALMTYAHSQAVKSNQEVTVTVKRNAGGTAWCVGAIDETAKDANSITHCECDVAAGNAAHCQVDGASQAIGQASFEKFKLNDAEVGGTDDNDFFFNFDPIRGIKTNEAGAVANETNELQLLSDNGKFSLQVDVDVTGRIRICSPLSSKAVPGFKACGGGPIVLPGG